MPKGGARIRSGPPPDPNALHRERDAGDWTTLPEDGRQGETPDWPLSTKATKAEATYWEDLWTKPQAVMWERQGQEHEVALYVRKFVDAAKPGAAANKATVARQMADSLGITIPGLLRNRWRIGQQSATQAPAKNQTATVSSRERFRVVDGSG